MQIELDKIVVENNSAESRFEVQVGGGQGLAGKMAKTALEYARNNGLDVVPNCPFVRAYIRRHSEYRELVSENFGEL